MTITLIIMIIILVILIIFMTQLMRAKSAFNAMIVKFVNINQVYYENQRLITNKFSNLIISLDKSINEMRDTLQSTKINFDNQMLVAKDVSVKLLNLNKKVETYSSDVVKSHEQINQKILSIAKSCEQLNQKITVPAPPNKK